MSDLTNQMISDRGSLERLMARIPGFRGYLDKAVRRTADRMLRDHLAGELSAAINRLAQIEKALLDGGGLMYMAKTASAKTKLQTFRDRVAAAAPGYSGFFAAVKIEAEDLDRLYAFDEMQYAHLDKITAALDTLQQAAASKSGIDEAVAALDTLAIEANDAFSKREDVVTGLGKQ